MLGCMGPTVNVSAKRITKRGTYSITNKKFKVKFSSNKITIKGLMYYGKKLTTFNKKEKKMGKGKKSFKLSKNIKYFLAVPIKDEKISKKEAKWRMKTISKNPGVAYFWLFVKNKKVYKVVISVC